MATFSLFPHFLLLLTAAALSTDAAIAKGPSPRWFAHSEVFEQETYYLVYDPKSPWDVARQACEDAGLVLAKVDTVELLDFLVKLAAFPEGGNGQGWVGGSRENRTDFVWVQTGEPLPSFFFRAGEPNNLGGTETCAQVTQTGGNDLTLAREIPFICTTRKEIVHPATTETTILPSTEDLETTQPSAIPTTTRIPGPDPTFCKAGGVFPDPQDCEKFHICEENEVGDPWDWVYSCPYEGSEIPDPGTCECQDSTPTQPPAIVTTTRIPGLDPTFCKIPGLFPDPQDCGQFRICEENEVGDLRDWIFPCPYQGSVVQEPGVCKCESTLPTTVL